MKWNRIVNESMEDVSSAISIDELIDVYITYKLNTTFKKLGKFLNRWDCQDTECNNQTECYFYLPNDLDPKDLEYCRNMIRTLLSLPMDYTFMEEDQSEYGNPELRLEAICHINV